MKKIKTFEDALKALKRKFNPPAVLSNDELAYMKLKIIAEALNEGWKPDWTDGNWKYWPFFKMGKAAGVGFSYDGYYCVTSDSTVGSRLCYKSRELAEYAGTQFKSLYKDFLTLEK